MSVRVGFLGAGFIARFHSKMLAGCGVEHERTGVHDPDVDRAERFVERAGGHVAASEDEVIDGCDAVYICTWTSEHPRQVEKACAAGKAVFVEKPLGVDRASAARVARAIEEAGVVHQVGLILRHSPAFAVAESFLGETERNGRVMSVVFRDDQFLPTGGHYASTWRADPERAGRGVLLEHSIHDVDLVDRLVGPVTAVRGESRSFHGIDGIEDLVVASFDLADGGMGTLTTIWHDMLERPSLRHLEVQCERMRLEVEGDWFGPVHMTRDGERITLVGDEVVAACADRGIEPSNPEAAFLRAVATGGPSMPTAAIALRAHELVDAIYASADRGGERIAL